MHLTRFTAIVLYFILWITVMPLAISEAPIPKAEANAEEHMILPNQTMPYAETVAEPHLAVSPPANVSHSQANETIGAVAEPTRAATDKNATMPVSYSSSPAPAAKVEDHFKLPGLFGYSGMFSLISVYWYIKYRKEIKGI